MESRDRVTDVLDTYLRIADISDDSRNGLQVQGGEHVRRVVGLVDASREGFDAAIEADADMVIVHHGLFWSSPVRLTGVMYERVRVLIEEGVSLYAAHLPLDAHEEVGNNAQLLSLLGAQPSGRYAEFAGTAIGCLGTYDEPRTLSEIAETLDRELRTQTRVYDFGPGEITTVGVISGSACDALGATCDAGADVFVTGEPRLSAYHEAREREINVAFAGHYATETVGIKALLEKLPMLCDVETQFIDVPCDI